jgi:hypothetical protein
MDVFAGIFSLLAVKTWAPEQISYPIYILLINLVEVMLILRPNILGKLKAK